MQRLRQAGLELDVNDERVLKEVALFADRADITEEITRLRHHWGQLKALLGSGGEIGRKAEFILQEIGREIHTIGSKANDLAISQRVIEFMRALGVPNGLAAVGYSEADIPALVEGTLPQHRVTKLSPVPAGPDELTSLFRASMRIW